MNRFTHIHILSFFCFGLILLSCGSETTSNGVDSNTAVAPIVSLLNFPEKQFDQFILGEEIKKNSVNPNKYALIDNGNPKHYIDFKDSTLLIIPDKKLDYFTVYMRSDEYVAKHEQLITFFKKSANHYSENGPFYSFHFDSNTGPFSMTYFKQEENIRLYFKTSTKHP